MDNKKIIRIAPTDEWVIITWMMSNRCNQNCCYCPPRYNSKDGKIYTIDEFKARWIDMFNKTKKFGLKYKVSFTGGEATVQKSFFPFLEWLYANYSEHMGLSLLTSNGSASVNYYLKAFKFIDNLSISVHSEFIDEKKFFDKLIKINKSLPKGKFFHVNIMDEPWNRDRIKYYEEILKEHDIYYSVNFLTFLNDKSLIPIFNGDLNLDISRPYKL